MASKVYLGLSIVSFFVTNYFALLIVREQSGFDFVRVWHDITLNASSQFVNSDLGMVALAGLAFIFIESYRLKIKWWWLSLAGTFLIGIGFGLPLFLFLRERKLLHLSAKMAV